MTSKSRYAGVALGIILAAVPGLSHAQTKSAVQVVVHATARHKPVDTPPSLDLYAAPPNIRQIALSPSGQQVAFLTRRDSTNILVVYRFGDKTPRYVKIKDGEIDTMSWADEGHVLLIASRPGLRGTCFIESKANSQRADADASVQNTQADAAKGNPAGDPDAIAAQMDLDATEPPGCKYFGVREQNAITLVDIAKSIGTGLGEHMGDATNMPLGPPSIVEAGGKRWLEGAFMEMRAANVGNQPAQRVYLWRVDPDTGLGKMVDDGGGDLDRESRYVDDWLVDRSGALHARAVYDFTREDFRIEMKDGATWRPVLTRPIVARDRTFAPALVGLAADGRSILILDSDTHGKDARGAVRHFHYYTLSPDGTLSAPLDTGDASQSQPIFSPSTGLFAGFSTSAEETTYNLTDPLLATLYAKAKDAASSQSVHVISVADDPHRMLIHVQGREDTGSYYLVDFATGTSVPIGEDHPNLPTDWIASQEQIGYRAADGTEIQALLTLPPKPVAQNLPLIVLPHDGPQGHDSIGFYWLGQALASRGYLVLQPNYRGSDGHGVDFMTAGIGEWNGKMLSDLSDGVSDLVAKGIADPKRVCYVGIGYGGYAAMKAAARPDTRCAVSINGISDVAGYLTWKAGKVEQPDTDSFAALIPDPKTPRGFGPDPDSVQMLRRYAGTAATDTVSAGAIRAPLLLINASEDPVVPTEQSHRLRDRLQDAKAPLTYLEIDGRTHSIDSEASRRAVLAAVTDFLARQNPAQN
jgi:dipeptidyl aminopeptidase/acylaminoacyl peptidase